MSEPTKAYLIRWTIGNDMEAIVYADNAKDALARFNAGEVEQIENTGNDTRVRKPTVRRWPEEDQ